MQKQIRKLGNSTGIIVDRVMQEISNIRLGDNVEIKCSKNKIILTKVQNTIDKAK